MRKTISLSLPATLDAELRQHVEERSINLSKLLQRLLSEYLRNERESGRDKEVAK